MPLNITKRRYITEHGTLTRQGAALTMQVLEAWKRGTIAPTPALTAFSNLVLSKCALSAAQFYETFSASHTKMLEIELLQSEIARLERAVEAVRRERNGIKKLP